MLCRISGYTVVEALVNLRCAHTALPEYWPLARTRARAGVAGVQVLAHLSRVHWVRPELVAEVKYLTWTGDNLLRQVVYEGLREDKPAAEVRRPVASLLNRLIIECFSAARAVAPAA
jgi:ATP dependent DNA ligase C terminal region